MAVEQLFNWQLLRRKWGSLQVLIFFKYKLCKLCYLYNFFLEIIAPLRYFKMRNKIRFMYVVTMYNYY